MRETKLNRGGRSGAAPSRAAAAPAPASPSPLASDASLNRPLLVFLAFAAVCLLFFRLGDYRTLGRHEIYATVPAREMLRSGDWVVPRFGGRPRLEKPPLGYWIVATSGMLLGGVNEFTARVPAALAALALSAVVGLWAGRWYGRTAGLGAALATVISVFVLTYGRRAEVDMFLCLFTTSALFLIGDQPAEEQGSRAFFRWTAVYALMALAWMAKFHYGPAMVLFPAFVYFGVQGRFRKWLSFLNPPGLVLMGAAIIVWPWVLLGRVPNAVQVWADETVGRAVGTLGRKPAWFYVPYVVMLTLPWAPLALLSIGSSWRRAWGHAFEAFRSTLRRTVSFKEGRYRWRESATRDDARERFLWVTFAVQFALITASANKHQHYLAAALPVLWILIGRGFARVVEAFRSETAPMTRRVALVGTAVFLACAAAVAAAVEILWPELRSTSLLISACVGIGGTLVVWLFYTRDYIPACYVMIGGFVGAQLVITGDLIPASDRHHAEVAAFVRSVRSEAGESTVWTYGLGMHAAIYYADEPSRRIESQNELVEQLEKSRSFRVVTLESCLYELAEVAAVRVIRRPEFTSMERVGRSDALVLADIACPSDIAEGPVDPQH